MKPIECGKPCKIGVKFFRLCESSHGLLKELGADISDHHAATICLANTAHDRVQEHVNQLVADGYGKQRKDTGLTEPLVGTA